MGAIVMFSNGEHRNRGFHEEGPNNFMIALPYFATLHPACLQVRSWPLANGDTPPGKQEQTRN
jgi:hypothetical protein